MAVTRYPELDRVLSDLTEHAVDVFGTDLVGSYVEGSFALGAGDMFSDVDFVVVVAGPVDREREQRCRAFHRQLPERPGHWTRHVEGSYALLADLRDPQGLGRQWLFIDHGHQEMTWDTHGNDEVHRWVLREHGIVLAGPPAHEVVAPVRAADLQAAARQEIPEQLPLLLSWLDLDVAWCQRYLVTTYCRELFTLTTGTVGSKATALTWAQDALADRWRPLLEQTLADRSRGFDRADAPPPGRVAASLAFSSYCVVWAAGR